MVVPNIVDVSGGDWWWRMYGSGSSEWLISSMFKDGKQDFIQNLLLLKILWTSEMCVFYHFTVFW